MKVFSNVGDFFYKRKGRTRTEYTGKALVEVIYTPEFAKAIKKGQYKYFQIIQTVAFMLNDMIEHDDYNAGLFVPYDVYDYGVDANDEGVVISFDLTDDNKDKITKDEFESIVEDICNNLIKLLDTSDIADEDSDKYIK